MTAETQAPQIPGYEILGELGRGAMGVVYRAKHKSLGRMVALKMILPKENVREIDLTRFQTEAEAAAALQHPNVAQLYEIGQYDGKPFFAMEFCPGGTLADQLQDAVLPANEAAALVRTLALAVQSRTTSASFTAILSQPMSCCLEPRAAARRCVTLTPTRPRFAARAWAPQSLIPVPWSQRSPTSAWPSGSIRERAKPRRTSLTPARSLARRATCRRNNRMATLRRCRMCMRSARFSTTA